MVEIYWYEFSTKNKIKIITQHHSKPIIPSLFILSALLLHIRRLNHLFKLHRKRREVQKTKAYHEQSQIHH